MWVLREQPQEIIFPTDDDCGGLAPNFLRFDFRLRRFPRENTSTTSPRSEAVGAAFDWLDLPRQGLRVK